MSDGADGERTVQYRVVVAKKDERVEGPDDADVVFTVPLTDAAAVPAQHFKKHKNL